MIDYGCHIESHVKIHCNCYVAQFTRIGERAFLAPGVTIANDLYPGRRSRLLSWPARRSALRHIGGHRRLLPYVRIGEGLVGAARS